MKGKKGTAKRGRGKESPWRGKGRGGRPGGKAGREHIKMKGGGRKNARRERNNHEKRLRKGKERALW